MRFRVRNENFIFFIVVLAVLLVGLVTALVIGGWYKYPPVMERSSQAPAAGPDIAVPVAGGVSRADDVTLLARIIQAEAADEPYHGKVAVGAVVLNRVRHASFPNSIPGLFNRWPTAASGCRCSRMLTRLPGRP